MAGADEGLQLRPFSTLLPLEASPAALGMPAFTQGAPSPFMCAWLRGTHSVLGPRFPPRGVVESDTSEIGTAFRGALSRSEVTGHHCERNISNSVAFRQNLGTLLGMEVSAAAAATGR